MTELRQIATEIMSMELEDRVMSKVTLHRNYCIKLYDKTAVLRPKSNTITSAIVCEIIEHHIRWYFFSKIKDAREALKILENAGYDVFDTTK